MSDFRIELMGNKNHKLGSRCESCGVFMKRYYLVLDFKLNDNMALCGLILCDKCAIEKGYLDPLDESIQQYREGKTTVRDLIDDDK